MFSKLSVKNKIIVIITYLLVVVFFGTGLGLLMNGLSKDIPTKGLADEKNISDSKNINQSKEENKKKESIKENSKEKPKRDMQEVNSSDSKDDTDEIVEFKGYKSAKELAIDAKFITAGKDVDAGIYKLLQDSSDLAHVSIYDRNINTDYIYDEYFENSSYISLEEGQVARLIGCNISNDDQGEGTTTFEGELSKNGKYLVGKDIPSGNYSISPLNNSGRFIISSDPLGRGIISKEYLNKTSTVTVTDGQYISILGLKIVKAN